VRNLSHHGHDLAETIFTHSLITSSIDILDANVRMLRTTAGPIVALTYGTFFSPAMNRFVCKFCARFYAQNFVEDMS